MSKKSQVLNWLKRYKRLTRMRAFTHFDVPNLTAIISDLRREGHKIETGKNGQGITVFKYESPSL